MVFQFLTLVIILTFGVLESSAGGLYEDDDPIVQLNTSVFDKTVLQQNNYWIIEYYMEWCGYCKRFAPHWKEFARDLQDWKSVIKVGAVHCFDPASADVCKRYGITSVPTLLVFQPHASKTDNGTRIIVDFKVASMVDYLRRELIKVLKNDCKDNLPPTWPYLCPVRAWSLSQLWQQLSYDTILLIVDHPSSYVAEELILDFSGNRNVPLLKVEDSNENLRKELSSLADLFSLPVLLKINRDRRVEILARRENVDENLREKFLKVINPSGIIDFITTTSYPPTVFTGTPISKTDAVYMQDLENSLRNFLFQELAIHDVLRGEKLDALKTYISALNKYFPGKPEVMRFLNKLLEWLMEQTNQIQVKNMINMMKEMETEDARLPPKSEWKGCKGSTPDFRGYPCSLWMLFHTLTVQAYIKHQQGYATTEEPWGVLFAIKGYVKNFFSCRECSKHFQQMAANLENELAVPEDVVLWLWKAHNKVNKRLASDVSTDPFHPKVQFPPEAACPQCRQNRAATENISWVNRNVLSFLLGFYGKERIVMYSDSSSQASSPWEHRNLFTLLAQGLLYAFMTVTSFIS